MNAPTAVLFDLDGTLVDTAPDMVAAANTLRRLTNRAELPFERLRGKVSKGAAGLVAAALECGPEHPDFDRYREEFLALYDERDHRESMLFPGMDAVLAQLEHAGIPWGIVTNKPSVYAMPLLAGLDLMERADAIVMGDTLEERKPHPAPLLYACREMAVAAEGTMYVGDDERDFIATQRAGMAGAVALWGYIDDDEDPSRWTAQLWLQSPAELGACLKADEDDA